MNWYDRIFSAKVQGIARSVLKRAGSLAIVLVIFQLFTLQMSVDNGSARQQEAARHRLTQALDALKESQAQSDAHNEQQNKKTQEYIKCLVGIILLPPSKRPSDTDTALDTCGKPNDRDTTSKTESSSAPVPSSASTSAQYEPTTSAPPDPSSHAARQPQSQANPLIDVRPLLNGAYQTVKGVPQVGGLLP